MRGLVFDNFFQRTEPGSEDQVGAAGVAAQLEWPLVRSGWLRGRAQLDSLLFDGIGPANGAELGLEAGGEKQSLRLTGGRSWGRPSFAAGDQLEVADGRILEAELGLRPVRWGELRAEAFRRWQTFPAATIRDVRTDSVGGAFRYRGFGHLLSPEIGFMRGDREAANPAQSAVYDERWIQLRSSPASWAYVSLRFRRRVLDYSVDDPGASNFARQDIRDQWALSVAVRTGRILTWNLYYATLDGRSSRPGRDFESSTLGFGLTLGVSESRRDLLPWRLWSGPL